MPVVVPKPKPVPVAPSPPPTPELPSAPLLTHADVQAMLAARDAAWSRQLQTVTEAFAGALKAIPPQKTPPAGWDFKVEYIPGSYAVKSIRALPITKTPKE